MQRCILIAILCLSCLMADRGHGDEGQLQFFREQVLPIWQQHCYACHSHDAGKMEGGLALDYRSGWEKGGDRGPAVLPGNPAQSLLYRAVLGEEADLKMPPDESLSPEQLAALRRWIEAGAHDDRVTEPPVNQATLWSLQPLKDPDVPSMKDQPELLNPIDAFLLGAIEPAQWQAALADRRTVIRRLYVDLLGYLPSYDDVAEFQADQRVDAYERLVDRLLASPAYGERWARHWLDTIHFAESHGFEHDVARPNAWTYRDYVIEQLNIDLPWSQFIRQQLATDFFYPDQPQWTAALGFLGAGTFDISSLTTAPMNFAYLDRDDMVTQTIGAFASLTVQCARCHAHKFDPISQDDYFALQAVFAGIVKGDVAYDSSVRVAANRRVWTDLLQATKVKNAEVLLDRRWSGNVRTWEKSLQRDVTLWFDAQPINVQATSDAQWKTLEDMSLLLQSPYPEVTTTTVDIKVGNVADRLTALRLEVLPDDSLPAHGPGAAVNGNLHLNEVQCAVLASDGQSAESGASRPLAIARAGADFQQSGWTAAHAIDSDPNTAWGIHPEEGKRHSLVLQFAEPLAIRGGCTLRVVLQQQHGRSHIIGRMRLAVTDNEDPFKAELPEAVVKALIKPAALRTGQDMVEVAAAALSKLAEEELAKLPKQSIVYAAGTSVPAGNGTAALTREKPHTIQVLLRGDLDKPAREIGPGALSAVPNLPSRFTEPTGKHPAASGEAWRRGALADWLADSQNPLTWRSIANRLWHYHFGNGLCDTPNDLGHMGGKVARPELLEWLACQVREHQSLKQLHRSIVMSQVYQLSVAGEQGKRGVPTSAVHQLLQELRGGAVQRLDADSFRDSVLQAAGAWSLQRGGPGVQQFSTSPGQQLTPQLDYQNFDWNTEAGSRRSIYRFVWRGIADPFMETMDFPDLGLLAPKRTESLSALQALATYNHPFVLTGARRLAQRVEHETARIQPTSVDWQATTDQPAISGQVVIMFRHVHQRSPTEEELSTCVELVRGRGLAALARVLLNSNEFLYLD